MAGVELAWALDVTLAGGVYRYATRDLVVDSLQYHSGLEVDAQSRVAELYDKIGISIVTADRWGNMFRAASYLVDGGECSLYLVIEENGTARRELWSRGVVDGCAWDRPGLPLKFALIPSASSYMMQSPTFRVDDFTIPSVDPTIPTPDTAWEKFPETHGAMYPMIIGFPGAFDDTTTIACVPAPVLQISYKDYTLSSGTEELVEQIMILVADGNVARTVPATGNASKVAKYDLGIKLLVGTGSSDDQFEQSIDQTNTELLYCYDALGQPVSYIVTTIGVSGLTGDSECYTGFGTQLVNGSGGGIQYKGKTLRAASDIFEWLVLYRSSHTLDLGRHRAHAEELNGYLFDTFVNAPIAAFDWFEDAVLTFIPAVVARGSDGVYLAHMPVNADAKDAILTLVEGVNCTRQGAPTVVEPTANELTVKWALSREYYNRQVTLTSEQNLAFQFPNGATWIDSRSRRNFLCEISQAVYGLRTDELEIPTVWDVGTAERVGANYLQDNALPRRYFEYRLLPEFYWLAPGDIILLTDADYGVTDQVCRVENVVIGLVDVQVTLIPLKGPTSYL